jgi:hypothetical protein
MTVPYIFANQSGPVPASELDTNFASVANNVATANTVVANAQPNITSVGTLTGLSVAGNVYAGNIFGNVNAIFSQTAGTVTATAQPNIAAVGTLTSLAVAGGFVGNTITANSIYTAGNITTTGNVTVTGNITGNNINGVVNGQLDGLVNGVNTLYGTWDFGYITANTYSNPIQWIFAVTPAGNIDMGNITVPSSLSIDIGTIF